MTPRFSTSATIVVVALIAVAGRPVQAAPSDRERARDKLAEGVRLLSAGDFKKALARFDEAYVLFPSPKLHYNRGLALEGLGRRADAFTAFTRFVEETKDPSPEYLKQAHRALERLKQAIGFLEVSTEPSGAEVRVDSERIGVTPLANAAPMEPGGHEVSARAPGFADSVRRVTVSAGERLNVKMDLRSTQLAASNTMPATETRGGLDLRPGPTVDSPPAGHASDESGSTESGSWQRPAAWGALAAGAGALGFGIYETFVFRNRRNEFDSLTAPDPTDPSKRLSLCGADEPHKGRDPACADLYSRGQTALTLSIVGYAAAAVLGGASAFLFSRSADSRSGATTAWSCGLGRRSASCRFSF